MNKPLIALVIILGTVLGGQFLQAGSEPVSSTPSPVQDASALQRALAASKTPVIVEFHASWCGACQALAPELAMLQREYSSQVRILTVDVDTAPELARQYGVSSIPHLTLFRNGKALKQTIGYFPASDLAIWADLDPRK
jgi:thioredoxin 1